MNIPLDMFAGFVHQSINYGAFTIVEYRGANDITISFNDTGCVRLAKSSEIRRGRVKDLFVPCVFGVGFIGVGDHSFNDPIFGNKKYNAWAKMIERCYSESRQALQPTYKGCTVCDEWLNFQNFAGWYDKKHPNDGLSYAIDKDILQSGVTHKVYSPDTCVLVTQEVNNIEAQAKTYKAVNPEGKLITIYNMKSFCIENNLSDGSMSSVLSGKRPHHKGWTRPL